MILVKFEVFPMAKDEYDEEEFEDDDSDDDEDFEDDTE